MRLPKTLNAEERIQSLLNGAKENIQKDGGLKPAFMLFGETEKVHIIEGPNGETADHRAAEWFLFGSFFATIQPDTISVTSVSDTYFRQYEKGEDYKNRPDAKDDPRTKEGILIFDSDKWGVRTQMIVPYTREVTLTNSDYIYTFEPAEMKEVPTETVAGQDLFWSGFRATLADENVGKAAEKAMKALYSKFSETIERHSK